MKRILGPLLLIILILGVGAAILLTVQQMAKEDKVVTVSGLVGSEKLPFFQDERVIEALRDGNLEAQVEKAGSRQIATSFDLGAYDFAFPAGEPAAEKIRREQGVSKSYDVFFTPMVVASWQPIAQLLAANGVATDQGGYYTLDLAAFLELVAQDTRWNDLANNSAYPVNKRILIASTDVRKSNSAAMYLSLASFVANDNAIVQSDADLQKVMPLVSSLFLEQGFQAGSSQAPFEDYMTMGIGKAPLVMIYEAQFIAAAAEGRTAPDMVLMYPEPTVFSKHILVPLSADGERFGELLQTDPTLQALAVEHGFRTKDMQAFREFAAEHQLAVPENLVSVIDPPKYEVLEEMIQQIEQQY